MKKPKTTAFMKAIDALVEEEGSQRALAKKLGLSMTTIFYWRNGVSVPSPKLALKLSKTCGIDPKISRPDLFSSNH